MNKKSYKTEYILISLYTFLTKYFVSINSIRFDKVFTESDQSIFLSIGKAILNGKILYKDVFDHKTPYIYFFNAFASVLEKNHLGLFIIEVTILTTILIFTYKLSKLFISNERAFIASLFLSTILSIPQITFGYSRTEMYAIAFLMPSIYLFAKLFLIEDDKKINIKHMFIIGVLASLTLMTNIRAVAIFVPFALLLFLKLLKERKFKIIFHLFIAGISAVLITILPYIIYAICTNSISDAIYAIFTTNLNYAKSNSALDESVFSIALIFISQNKVFFIFLFLSFVFWFLLKFDFRMKIAIIISFLITFLYVVFSYKTNVYYLVILMPYMLSIFYLLTRSVGKLLANKKVLTLIFMSLFFLSINIFINKDINIRYLNCINRSARINKAIEDNLKGKRDIKVLSYGFNPDVYIYTGGVVEYKFFIIPNVSYKVDSTAYDAQYNYIMSKNPDVVIYANSSAGNEMPKAKFDMIRYTLSTSYKLVDEFNTNDFTGIFYIFIKS